MKRAIVIGATSGIGRALAERLAAEGYRVGVTGRREALLEELAEKTMHATHEVDAVVRTIQDTTAKTTIQADDVGQGIDTVAEATGKSGAALRDISQSAQESAQLVRSIEDAAHQQAQLTQDMYSAMENIRVLSARTSEVMEHTQYTTGDMARQAESLTGILRGMRQSLDKK